MPMYTFNLCKPDGAAPYFAAFELAFDGETIVKAGELLEEHLSCDHVEIWDGARAVAARHRYQPVLRPVAESAA